MNLEQLRGKLLISLVIDAIVFIGLSASADFGDVISGLGDFDWQYLPAVLLLSLANYVLRFLKWQYYLNRIGVSNVSWRDSALTYFSGLGMVVTPGKVGEWLKCFLLRELNGTPVSRSAPLPIAERLTDSLALVILGAAGLLVFGDLWPAFLLVVLGAALLVLVARYRPLALWLLGRLERLPLLSRFARPAQDFYSSSYALPSPGALIFDDSSQRRLLGF